MKKCAVKGVESMRRAYKHNSWLNAKGKGVLLVVVALFFVGFARQGYKIYQVKQETIKTETGGANQKNNCHVAELMCACAAYDFFNIEDNKLGNNKAQYLYRSAPFDGSNFSFDGSDFVGTDKDKFENEIGRAHV